MANPQISVIIPVYNAAKYLNRCVDSILAQTFHDFELLLIDDGSGDASGIICDKYAELDGRVRIVHKNNGGVSSARNKGLEKAIGQYVVFCDSDDCVETDYLETLYPKNCEDLVCCSYKQTDGISIFLNDSLDKKEILQKNAHLFAFGVVWGKLYKMSIIKENNILFRDDISFGEDILFVLNYWGCKLNNVVTKSKDSYIYNNENSASLSRLTVPLEQTYKLMELMDISYSKLSLLYNWNCSHVLHEYQCSQFFNLLFAIRTAPQGIVWKSKQLFKAINNRYIQNLLMDSNYWQSRGNNSFFKRISIFSAQLILRGYYNLCRK